MSDADMLIRLVSAALLGSINGLERERILWAAGIRTAVPRVGVVADGCWRSKATALAPVIKSAIGRN
jgi:uncharacterized membrane protein YhiD involved in acid resistance